MNAHALPAVAVIGTGTMGFPMARNIARAGFQTRAWNRSREKAEPLREYGVTIAETVTEALVGAEFALTMLADADAVLDALGGGDALGCLTDDGVWIQTSTVGLDGTERCAEAAARAHVAFVDAPVLGTKAPAEQGKLVVLASGPEEVGDRVRPIFDAIGSRTLWLGDAGAGTRLKLVANGWVLLVTEGLAETFAFAEALGVDPARFLEAIEGGALDLPYAHMKGKQMLERSFEDASFSLRLAQKDAELIRQAAEREHVELPLLRALAPQLMRAVEAGHGDEDMAATYLTSTPRNGAAGADR